MRRLTGGIVAVSVGQYTAGGSFPGVAGELWRRSATDLARMIADGTVTSRQVIEARLARIESVNHHLNAVVLVLAEQALAADDAADISARGPLHGVPFTVKEDGR